MSVPKKLIKEVKSITELLEHGDTLLNLTLQNLDLRETKVDWKGVKLANTTFLGCDIDIEDELVLREKGAVIYPKIVGLPYNPYRKSLYTWQELMEGYDANDDKSTDLKIYTHFDNTRYTKDINEALSQRIHDHAIDDALQELIEFDENGMPKKKCVGVMGGHGVLRTDAAYEKVAKMTKNLTEKGYFILSGGGPGVMEAANLGAYFGGKTEEDLLKAIEILKQSPKFTDPNYVTQSNKVIEMYPEGVENLAIPTWFYGHEPSNLFATHIAKYFSNSIREDVLLSASVYGIIYAPGSAGTIQEIFADASQNHYQSYGYTSPMIFLDKKYWSEDRKVYQLLKSLSEGLKYGEMITISDEINEIVDFIEKNPPVKVK
ncbi:LOG family protein [Patescibacteria group bacterium]